MTNRMAHENYEELLAAYALGVLDGGDLRDLEAHLAGGCGQCGEMLPRMMETASDLSRTLRSTEPPPELKSRLFAGLGIGRARRPRAPYWAYLAAASVLVSIGIWAWRAQETAPVAQIALAGGEVLVNGRTAGAGQAVRPAQSVSTGDQSEAIARLAGGAADIYLMGRARAVMPKSAAPQDRVLRLSEGRLLSFVRPGEPFSVETPQGRIAALGTTFFVEIDSADQTYVCICSGRILVSSGGKEQAMEATHHAAMEIVDRAGRREFVPAIMRDHTDSDIAVLQSLQKKSTGP